jgi:hypothetical protein
MNEIKETDQGAGSLPPTNEDATTLFCFSTRLGMSKAHGLITGNKHQYWAEQRRAEKGVMYPYWLVCQADKRAEIEEILRSGGIQWKDIESHYYAAVKDQSSKNISAENSPISHRKIGRIRSGKSTKNRWWQFWK